MGWLVGYKGEGEFKQNEGQNKGGEDVNEWRYVFKGMADNGGSSLYRES